MFFSATLPIVGRCRKHQALSPLRGPGGDEFYVVLILAALIEKYHLLYLCRVCGGACLLSFLPCKPERKGIHRRSVRFQFFIIFSLIAGSVESFSVAFPLDDELVSVVGDLLRTGGRGENVFVKLIGPSGVNLRLQVHIPLHAPGAFHTPP